MFFSQVTTMSFKPSLFLFTSFLLLSISTTISFNDLQLLQAAVGPPPLVSVNAPPVPEPLLAPPPVYNKPPGPAPPVNPTPPPSPPTLPTPPIKSPIPAPPPLYKPPTPPKTTKDCYPLCVVRCKLHSRKNICLRACVTCCDQCKCVPPGQSGNREKCGKCYVNMTTHGGKPKCP